MSKISELSVCQKVYAYILCDWKRKSQLLVFEHVCFPEAGIQVPGGSVELGEGLSEAVRREVREETNLTNLILVRKIGSVRRDMRGLGIQEVHHRHYFLFRSQEDAQETWISYEETPSDGSEGPIAFRFFWVPLEAVIPLQGGLDEMLCALH